jgi:hypothetical protein
MLARHRSTTDGHSTVDQQATESRTSRRKCDSLRWLVPSVIWTPLDRGTIVHSCWSTPWSTTRCRRQARSATRLTSSSDARTQSASSRRCEATSLSSRGTYGSSTVNSRWAGGTRAGARSSWRTSSPPGNWTLTRRSIYQRPATAAEWKTQEDGRKLWPGDRRALANLSDYSASDGRSSLHLRRCCSCCWRAVPCCWRRLGRRCRTGGA